MLRKDIHQERPSILCEKDGGPSDLQASVLDGTNVAKIKVESAFVVP